MGGGGRGVDEACDGLDAGDAYADEDGSHDGHDGHAGAPLRDVGAESESDPER
jgi:hypothetical protein